MNVVAWFCGIAGFPRRPGRPHQGGSLANFIALVTARRERLPENFLSGTIYASDQTHHSIQKAAMLAGFPQSNVRDVPSDERFRLRLDPLARGDAAADRRGLQPFLVVGNAGTTNTGASIDARRRSPISRARETGSGSMSTAPTAASSPDRARAAGAGGAGARRLGRRSIRTRASSFPTAPAPCWCATARR